MDSKKGLLPSQFANVKIPWGPIGEQVYKRTYSQTKSDGRKETWPETVVRAVDGNIGLVDPSRIEPDEREKLIGLLLSFDALPAGRHLNASGMPGRQFLFNCHASGWDNKEPEAHFTFLFDALMMGGGVGANYSNRYMESLPAVQRCIELHIICRPDHKDMPQFWEQLSTTYQRSESFTETLQQEAEGQQILVAPKTLDGIPVFRVPDSREGWVDSIGHAMKKAFESNLPHGPLKLIIDVSPIRHSNLPLKTSGGISCGPGPLVTALTDVVRHLNACEGRKMKSLDGMTIDHSLAGCVIAGGKRRSSRMSVKSWRDQDIFEFIHCKMVDGLHWTTNISVEVDDLFYDAYYDEEHMLHEWSRRVMHEIVVGKKQNGEPGIWNRSLAMKGEKDPLQMYCPNPCGEIGLYMWENCNLGHVNMANFARRPMAEMEEAFRLMTRWLMRATFGDVPNPRQRKVLDENRRIGVGFFGFHEWLALNGVRYSDCVEDARVVKRLMRMKERVDHESYRYSQMLGIPCPVKTTTLAPTGSVVCLPGTTASGQAMMAPRFKRLVRYASNDPELAIKKLEGYEVFPDEDAKNTEIVVYWCEDPLVAKVRAAGFDPEEMLEGQYDLSFETSLKVQAMLQDIWANNAISFTINLSPDKMPSDEQMEMDLMKYLPRLKGTTVFAPVTRKNVPIQPLTKEEWDAYTGRKEVTMVEDECKGACPIK